MKVIILIPLSMKQSILNLSKIQNNNCKYVLLGDMLELGGKPKLRGLGFPSIINQIKYQ